MSKAIVIFNYNGQKTTIQCSTDDKFSDICAKFERKVFLDLSRNYCFLYNGNRINKELKFSEIINKVDKINNTMNILVDKLNNTLINDIIKESEEIICPICHENILIKINDYRINLFNCKNNHNIKDITLTEFINSQKIDISKIICDICKEKSMGNINNNDMYKCLKCDKNLCPLCQLNHDKSHIIIQYGNKNIICNKHNEIFI